MTKTEPASSIMMFSGFRSRWMIPLACAASSASSVLSAISIARSGSRGPAWLRSWRSVSPWIHSIDRYRIPPTSPRSWTRQTFGWVTCRVSRTSRLKPLTNDARRANSGRISFSARTLSSAVSIAL